MIGNYPDGPIGEIAIGGIDDERAERLAIALGRLGGQARKAAPSGLVELLGLGSATKPDVIGSWRQPPSDRLTVAVGSDDSASPVTIGFRRDGPHGMIAGTTGSGKSELLQTILTALAAAAPARSLDAVPRRLQGWFDIRAAGIVAACGRARHRSRARCDAGHRGVDCARRGDRSP